MSSSGTSTSSPVLIPGKPLCCYRPLPWLHVTEALACACDACGTKIASPRKCVPADASCTRGVAMARRLLYWPQSLSPSHHFFTTISTISIVLYGWFRHHRTLGALRLWWSLQHYSTWPLEQLPVMPPFNFKSRYSTVGTVQQGVSATCLGSWALAQNPWSRLLPWV